MPVILLSVKEPGSDRFELREDCMFKVVPGIGEHIDIHTGPAKLTTAYRVVGVHHDPQSDESGHVVHVYAVRVGLTDQVIEDLCRHNRAT